MCVQHGQVSLLLCVDAGAVEAAAAAAAGDGESGAASAHRRLDDDECLRALGVAVLAHHAADLADVDAALSDSALAREAAKATSGPVEGVKFAYLNRASSVLKLVGMGALGKSLRHRTRVGGGRGRVVELRARG